VLLLNDVTASIGTALPPTIFVVWFGKFVAAEHG
jgi:hypothetical protein